MDDHQELYIPPGIRGINWYLEKRLTRTDKNTYLRLPAAAGNSFHTKFVRHYGEETILGNQEAGIMLLIYSLHERTLHRIVFRVRHSSGEMMLTKNWRNIVRILGLRIRRRFRIGWCKSNKFMVKERLS